MAVPKSVGAPVAQSRSDAAPLITIAAARRSCLPFERIAIRISLRPTVRFNSAAPLCCACARRLRFHAHREPTPMENVKRNASGGANSVLQPLVANPRSRLGAPAGWLRYVRSWDDVVRSRTAHGVRVQRSACLHIVRRITARRSRIRNDRGHPRMACRYRSAPQSIASSCFRDMVDRAFS